MKLRINEKETPNIEVKHEGILEVPEGKNVDDLPLSHFVDLANKKGLSKITKALNNLQVWNKNDDPKLSKWAGNMIDKLNRKLKKNESIQVSGYDDASRKLKALSDGEIIQYTGNKLGGVVEAVANALEVGDEFTISAEVGYIAPGPDNDGTRTITTTFLVTDAYRYGNGYAPIYQGRSPQLNANQSRRWRDITNGALWLLGNREYTFVIHKSSQSITSATAVEGAFNMKRKFTEVPGRGIFAGSRNESMKLTNRKTYDTEFGPFTISTMRGKARRRDPLTHKSEWKEVQSTGGTFDEYPNAVDFYVERDGNDRYVTSSQGEYSKSWIDSLSASNYDDALSIVDNEVVKCFQDYYNDSSIY